MTVKLTTSPINVFGKLYHQNDNIKKLSDWDAIVMIANISFKTTINGKWKTVNIKLL